jgi:hypothetical protein
VERIMPDKIDTRVSPALDPERFRLMEGYNDDTRPFVDVVINAFSAIHTTLGRAHDARRLAESNPALTPENRILVVSREIAGAKERELKRLASAERVLRANILHTEKALSEPLTERAGMGALNGEVRGHVKSLKPGEREAFMNAAFERGDEATLTAVLGGMPYLSGLTPLDHEHYTRLYHVKRNPQLVARLDLMQRFIDEIERSNPIVHAQFERAVGAKPGVVAGLKKLEDQSNEALAALRAEPTV